MTIEPITPEGRSRSQNATTHGATSQQLILPGESQEDFDQLVADLAAEYQPETAQSHGYVYDAARARWDVWRKQRIYDSASAEIHIQQPNPTQWSDATFHRLHLLDHYKTAAERAFKRAITNVELLLKNSIATEERELRHRRWDRQFEAKQAGAKLTALKKELEITKVTDKLAIEKNKLADQAYRRACNGFDKPTFVQNIEVVVCDGRTHTLIDLDNDFVLEYLDIEKTYPIEQVVRKYLFPEGIQSEYHWTTDREDWRNEKQHTVEQSITLENFRLLAQAEKEQDTGHCLFSHEPLAA
jgi:hypothetical protein